MTALLRLFPCLMLVAAASSLGGETTPWTGQWIGQEKASESNLWLCFRKTAELDAVPETAPVRIACDSKYWLWVNGEMVVFEGQVKRGPNPRDTYFDELDLAPHLRPGSNTIAVLLWYWGRPGFSHNSSGKAGLVIDGGPFPTDQSWKVSRHPAYGGTGEPHPNFRLPEPNIRFDANEDIGPWMMPDFDDSDWAAAAEFGVPPVAPWGHLHPRLIPLWSDTGLIDFENAAELPAISDGGVIVAKLPYNAQVTPYLKVESPAGHTIDLRTDNYIVTNAPTVRAEYVTRDGVQEYESFGWMNGHEVHYTIPKGVRILALKYRETGYDAEFAGSFQCDDPALNQLWEESRRTLHITMRDTYMDCPDRERAQWWGDAVNELGEAFYVYDARNGPLLAKKGMLELVNWVRPDGSLYSPVPSTGHGPKPDTFVLKDFVKDGTWNYELPMQMLASVGWYGFWTYYWNTGDVETITRVYPTVRGYLDLWEQDANGLVIHRSGEWDWPDWGKNADVAILDNTWLHLALKGAVAMARVSGNEKDIPAYQEKMRAIENSFNGAFWQGDHYKSPAHEGEIDDRANAMAVVAGLARPDQYPAIRRVLDERRHASPYMEKYVLEALFLMDAPGQAMERMKSRYKVMLEDNYTTLYENFISDPQQGGKGTYNHAWSGGPLTMLSQYAAGIAPTEPAWKAFDVRPQPGPLKSMDSVVPTPHGDITFSFRREGQGLKLGLTVPQGTEAKIGVPKPDEGLWHRIRLNDTDIWPDAKRPVKGEPRYLRDDSGYQVLKLPPGKYVIETFRAPLLDDLPDGTSMVPAAGRAGEWIEVSSDAPFSEKRFDNAWPPSDLPTSSTAAAACRKSGVLIRSAWKSISATAASSSHGRTTPQARSSPVQSRSDFDSTIKQTNSGWTCLPVSPQPSGLNIPERKHEMEEYRRRLN